MINYIMNNRNKFPTATAREIQAAIWTFSDTTRNVPQYLLPHNIPLRKAIVLDAELNGNGFKPGPGQKVAVLVDSWNIETSVRYQLLFVEVEVPSPDTCIHLPSEEEECEPEGGLEALRRARRDTRDLRHLKKRRLLTRDEEDKEIKPLYTKRSPISMRPETCGNHKVEYPEECEPKGRDKSCTRECRFDPAYLNKQELSSGGGIRDVPRCGDGILSPGEECDYRAPGVSPKCCTRQCTLTENKVCGRSSKCGNAKRYCNSKGGCPRATLFQCSR
jgi:hypothetical protein